MLLYLTIFSLLFLSISGQGQYCCVEYCDETSTGIVECPTGLTCCTLRPLWQPTDGGQCYNATVQTCAYCPVYNPNHPEYIVCPSGCACSEADECYNCPSPVQVTLVTFSGSINVPALDQSYQLQINPAYKILGGGATTQVIGEALLTASYPVNSNTWYAEVKQGAYAVPANLTIYVIALYDPNNDYSYQIVEAQSALGQSGSVIAYTTEGYTLTGGGSIVQTSADYGYASFLYATYPTYDGTGWASYFSEHVGWESEAQVTSYAIGIKATSGAFLSNIISGVSGAQAQHAEATVSPAPGTGVVTGGGAYVDWTDYGNFLYETIPVLDANGTAIGWTAASKDQDLASPAIVTVYAVSVIF